MNKQMESIIGYIRNVLRKEGITGMDSINHCIVFVICRMLDENLCKKIKIDKKYAYENIMKDENGEDIGDTKLYKKIFEKGKTECFIGQLVNVLGFKNIKFKMEGTQNLGDIMRKMKDFDVKKLNLNYDIIGTIYEIHLKSGTSNAMRDLGQYYTHRLVINYMIGLCDPKMENGIIEKIVDPTMGTGGFLTMAIKYLNEKYNNKINWNKNKDNIIGFDIDDNVKNMAMLNIFLETGELCNDTLVKEDTLYRDLRFANGKILEKAKIILANEPMGLKNIIHNSCCDRIKDLKIKGTKAEPLFLQLFMEALDDGGRCAVIVPNGVLFGESNLHVGTKKYLVENFNLKKIIELNGDFFLNTGVQTSILFFEKDGKKTSEIEFCQLVLNGNSVNEKTVAKIKYDEVKKNDYYLFINKYININKKKIENVIYMKINDLFEYLQKSKRPASYGKEKGKYSFYTSGETIKRCDDNDYKDECIIIGDGGCANIYIDSNFSCSDHNYILKSISDKINNKYVYYYFLTNIDILENGFKGSTIKNLSKNYINDIEIPLPPLNIQNDIVNELDIITDNIKNSQKCITETKKILKMYIGCKITNEKTVKFDTVCDTSGRGKFYAKDLSNTGEYPFYGASSSNPIASHDTHCFDGDEYILFPRAGGSSNNKIDENSGLGKSYYVKGKTCGNVKVVQMKKKGKDILTKYIYYFLMYKHLDIQKLAYYTTGIGNLNVTDIDNLDINLPSIDIQKEIINYCDYLEEDIDRMTKRVSNNKKLMNEIINKYIIDGKNNAKLHKSNDIQKAKKNDSDMDLGSNSDSDVEEKKPKKIIKKNNEEKVVKKIIKKEETCSDSDSDIEEKKPVKVIKKKKVEKTVKKVVKKEESSSESDWSDSDDDKVKKSSKKSKK